MPKIGLVVEGETEYAALPYLLQKAGISCGKPSCFHGQPVEMDLGSFVKYRLLKHVRAQLAGPNDLVIVVLDAEDRPMHPHIFETKLKNEIRRQIKAAESPAKSKLIEVIVCVRKFENWLISDPQGIIRSPYIRQDLSNAVNCHADDRNALELLKRSFPPNKAYRKASHGPDIAQYIRVDDPNVHLCSASFRRLLDLVRSVS